MFGAMFAYRPKRAAAELLRVTRPGGRVAMANWTPEGFIGKMLRAHTSLVPPPSGVPTELFATCYGPTGATLRATDPEGSSGLTRLFQQHNLATDGTTAVAGEYLDVRARIAVEGLPGGNHGQSL